MSSVDLKCPTCGIEVIFERKPVSGFSLKTQITRTEKVVVYLVCDNGHPHRYEVTLTPKEEGSDAR
jgi:hypothetical protein